MLIFFSKNLSLNILLNFSTVYFYIILYSKFLFFFIDIKNKIIFNTFLNFIYLQNIKLSLQIFLNIFHSWEFFFIQSIYIYGKNFKIKKKKKYMLWSFNASNYYKFFTKTTIFQKINKKNLIIISKTKNNKIITILKTLIKTNLFIKKLIKLNRSYLFKKKKKQ